MKGILRVGISLFLITLMSSCIRDGELLDNCFRLIRIQFQWIDTEPLSPSEQVNVAITPSNGTTQNITSNVTGRDVDLMPATYTLVGYEQEENVTINEIEGVVSVNTLSDGSLLEPTLFSAGKTTAEVVLRPDTLIIPIPMYQQTRPLIIEVLFRDTRIPIINEFPPVKELSAVLHGVTLERNINDGFVEEEREIPVARKRGDIPYNLQKSELSRQDSLIYIDSHNLLGLDFSTHILDLHVEFENGLFENFSVDVTEQIAGFHSKEIHKPWYIIITLTLDSSLNVSIQDWIAGPDSWLTAM